MVNTSFNVRGEPIVNTPEDAYRCFMGTEMNLLALGDYLLFKKEQSPWRGRKGHVEEDEPETGTQKSDMSEDLEEIYLNQLLPVATNLKPRINILDPSGNKQSLWMELDGRIPGKDVFMFYNLSPGGAAEFAERIISRWEDRDFGRKMAPVIVRMIDLHKKYPPPEDFSEEVSDSVYVMF
jgi:carbamoyltransferase